MIQEKPMTPMKGWFPLFAGLGLVLLGPLLLPLVGGSFSQQHVIQGAFLLILAITSLLSGLIGLAGLLAVQPNQARVLLLFGEYQGTVSQSGFYWVNPFYSKKSISLRIRNFETGSDRTPEQKDATGKVVQAQTRTHGRPSKVNDRDGNPIEISAVVVWRVVNTAEAMFEVDDFEDFLSVQSEAALRSLATRHPYDNEDHETSLRGSPQKICDELKMDIQERLHKAGIEIIEARICHLAYAPEIASAMLQRQQAQAVVAARRLIVDGAVGMVQMALEHLSRDHIVELDDERKAAMVSNLLVVLCGDRHVQPVVNAGSIYH